MDTTTTAKLMTPAYKRVDDCRNQRHINRVKLLAPDLSCVVYRDSDKLLATGYRNRALKPAFNFRFGSLEKLNDYVNNWVDSNIRYSNEKKEKKHVDHDLQVNDILYSSWGYDQTNVDFYMVTKTIGKSMVEIVEIGSKGIETSNDVDSYSVLPDLSKIIGEPMRKKPSNGSIRINSSQHATKAEYTIKDDRRIYRSYRVTAFGCGH